MRIAICDDDKKSIDTIHTLLKQWASLSNQSVEILLFENGDDLIKENKKCPIDIILLDIIMPLFNGLETATELREFDNKVKIIFLTSSESFAVDSYKVDASNYLLKPIEYNQLAEALYKVIKELQIVEPSIIVHTANTLKKIYLNEIEYVEASRRGTDIFLTSKVILESINPLYYFEQLFKNRKNFYKCHRSYIVNLSNIDSFTMREIKTKTGYRIPIARTKVKEFKKEFLSFYFTEESEKGEGSR